MINLSKSGDTIVFEFINNGHYLENGTIEVPINSLSLVTDSSNMATFYKADSGDIFISATYDELGKTKAEMLEWFEENMVGGGGIDSGAVQTQIDQSISGFADSVLYDSTSKYVEFYHGGTGGTKVYEFDASDFVIDGMVDDVRIETISGVSYLVIDFNTASGKEDIQIPLTDIFDPSNYYTKTEVDGIVSGKADSSAVTTALNNKANKTAAFGSYFFGYFNDIDYLRYRNVDNTSVGSEIYFPKINGKSIFTNNSTFAQNNYNFQLVETSAITSAVTSASTDSEVPSAKAVYDVLSGKTSVVNLTQAEYDALVTGGTVDPTVLYNITDATPIDMSQYWTSAQTNSAITQAVSGKQDTLSAGTNITIVDNVISAEGGGGGKAIEAGRGISVTTGETADTVSFNLPISAGTGTNSIIEGYSTSAMSSGDHAEGKWTYANGNGYPAHAEGEKTSAMTNNCHAEGRLTKASGDCAHAEGNSTVAEGKNSHAEGNLAKAYGECTHAEGYSTSATSNSNVSGIQIYMGYEARHAEGCHTKANNGSTHTEGYYTNANNFGEHASGVYNVSNSATTAWGDSGNTLFSVGNGTANNNRHNAFEIRQNGDIYITSGGTDIKLQDNLGSAIEVSSAITSGDTNPVQGGVLYDKFDEVEQVTAAALNLLNDRVTEDEEVTAAGLNAINDKFDGLKLKKLTQAQYDALSPNYDNNTLYVVV